MPIVDAILKIISGRATVRSHIVPQMVGYLRVDLEEKGFPHAEKISAAVGLVIVQEALHRAAESEKDGRARNGEFNRNIELAADNIIAAFNGEENVDTRIKNILVFHKLL